MDLSHGETAEGGSDLVGAGDFGLHRRNVPQAVPIAQPHAVRAARYRKRVSAADPRDYLWRNICALMGEESPSLDRVVERVKVGRGTVQRIRDGEAQTASCTSRACADRGCASSEQKISPARTESG